MNRKILAGIMWNLTGLFASRGATLLFTLFLARFLAPEDFGLLALTAITFELANVLIQSGLRQALIRAPTLNAADLNTAFFSNLVVSGIVYGALFFVAPLLTDFYGEPLLTPLVRVTGTIVFLNSLKLVQSAVLFRNMNFRVETVANTIGATVSGAAALSLAYFDAGVWSLVTQMLGAAAVGALILWIGSDWRPAFDISLESFRRLYGFGYFLTVEGTLEVLFHNSYVVLLGILFTAPITGLYFFARKITTLLSKQLTMAVQQATFPALAQLQDDREALRRKYRQIIQLSLFALSPVMLIFAAAAEPLTRLLFHEEWSDAVPLIQLFCLLGLIFPLHAMNVNILNVMGRSDLVLKVGLIKKGIGATLLVASIPFGVSGIVVGQVLASYISLLPNTHYSRKLIDYGLGAQVLDAGGPVLSAVTGAFVTYVILLLMEPVGFVQMLAAVGLGLGAHIAAGLIMRVEACDAVIRWTLARTRAL